MLPRPKSIFNIGGDGGDEVDEATQVTGIAPEGLIGLRIAIQHHGRGSNIVIKSALKACRSDVQCDRPTKSLSEVGFLKSCLFCMRKLSLQKEVYMYRGDQGFCSDECRNQQILIEERRELETSKKKSHRALLGRHSSPKVGQSNRRRRISAAA